MTDLTQPAPTTPPGTPPIMTTGDDLLPLHGNYPVTVYVKVDRSDNNKHGFSQDKITWYKGMKWHHGDEYELYITYVLETEKIELVPAAHHPELWFSPIFTGPTPLPPTPPPAAPQKKQLGSVPPVPNQKTYKFRIAVKDTRPAGTDVAFVDPEIIVTPANAGSNDD